MPRTKRSNEAVDPRKRPLQGRSRSTVDAILEAAAQVLERDGYTASTTDLIAERAGVSIGSVYQYFPNKDALLLALAQRHADAARAVLEPLLAEVVEGTPPVGPWLRRFVRAIVELNGRRPRLHQILFEETPFPQENMEEMYRAGELIVGIVESYLARAADVKVANPRLAAYLLFRSIGGIAHAGVVRRPPDLTMQDCGEELILILVRYLTGGDDTPLAR
jgi:AcrR family transcriptional regulator